MESPKTPGLLIVGMGLPGCGKSSVFQAIADLCRAPVFLEPEEDSWPDAVHRRDEVGHFTGLSWFRAARVPKLFSAAAARAEGRTAFVDSYYDKLLHGYLSAPAMRWLIAPDDPYFAIAKEMARLDYEHLPDADVVVFFDLDESLWQTFVSRRGRRLDASADITSTFRTQQAMRDAATEYCRNRGKQFVPFRQELSSPLIAGNRLLDSLRAFNILT